MVKERRAKSNLTLQMSIRIKLGQDEMLNSNADLQICTTNSTIALLFSTCSGEIIRVLPMRDRYSSLHCKPEYSE